MTTSVASRRASTGGMSRGTGPWGARLRRLIPPIVAFVVFVALWEGGAIHGLLNVKAYTLSYPSQILDALAAEWEGLSRQAAVTLAEALIGYVVGSALGFAIAVICVWIDPLRRFVLPVVNGFVAMPIIALAPLMALYLGSGVASKIAVVVLMTFPPMAVSATKGLRALEPSAFDLMRSYAAPEASIFRKLRLPNCLPFAFTALRLNVTLALIGAIIAEMFSAQGGLGFVMSRALVAYDMPTAWAVMFIAGAAGVALFLVVGLFERMVIPWHASMRGG
jgi:NitT/TauT family transport system permease protein